MGVTQLTNMEIPKGQVEALIIQGQKKGLTGKDVIDALIRKGYQPEGVNVDAIKQTMVKKAVPATTEEPSFVEGLKNDLNTRVDKVGTIQNRTDSSGLEKTVQTFGQGAGLAANAIEKTVEQIPGVKQTFGAIGSGINWLATSELSPIKQFGDEVGKSKALQEVTMLYDTDQNFKDSVDAVANIVRLGGDVQMAADAVNFTKNVTSKIKTKAGETFANDGTNTPLLSPEGQAMVNKVVPDSASIMNRVARLKPTDATKFEKLAGETHGEYLKKSGNTNAPDEIISNEAKKFSETINAKDAELAKLPGLYKNGAISDALEGLLEKAKSTSSTNIKSPYLDKVKEWVAKHDSVGLSNEEINLMKRLYEKEVKLGYNKLTNGDKVQQATNIDSALRKFQDKTAKDLGFDNIPELNKQIQISKLLVDKLGDQVVGQNGLNGVNLTDWIMLSGGRPEAVAGFLTKKFFSSKGVQAKIAEYMNKGDIVPTPKPNVTPTIESNLRQTFPQGVPKQLPAGTKPVIENRVPQPMRGASSMEKSADTASRTTINPKTGDKYVRDLKTKKVTIIPSKQTPLQPPKTKVKKASSKSSIKKNK